MVDPHRQIDSRIEIVTPENIAFEYRVAGPFSRLPAYMIDLVIRFLLLVVLSLLFIIVFGVAGLMGMGVGMTLVTWFVVSWLYGGLFETFLNGQTPGKRLMNLRVLSTDGQPINALQAVLRNVLRSVDGLPIVLLPPSATVPLYQLGLLASFANDRYQRLGDLACGTIVVFEDRPRLHGVALVNPHDIMALAAALPNDYVVDPPLARTLAKYVERRRQFGASRRSEIARHLGDVLVERFQLPHETDRDQLLCALYHRTFIADRASQDDRSDRTDRSDRSDRTVSGTTDHRPQTTDHKPQTTDDNLA